MNKLLTKAIQEIGVTETANPARIREYHLAVGKKYSPKVSWCSSFINWCAKECGLERSNSAVARTWMSVGKHVTQSDAQPGDVLVLMRGTSKWKGHVGIIIGETSGSWIVLGGNQRDAVRVALYSKARTLAVRRLE